MPGISAPRARVLEKLELEPFRSKTLLPGSMTGISAPRARAGEARLTAVWKQNATSGIYARDFRGARARLGLDLELAV